MSCEGNGRFQNLKPPNGGIEMEITANVVVPLGLAIGYFLVFLQTKSGHLGYFVIGFFCLIHSATYAWEAYEDALPNDGQLLPGKSEQSTSSK